MSAAAEAAGEPGADKPGAGDPDGSSSAPGAPRPGPYDDLVPVHLRTIVPARLWVGDGLARANWAGLNETFGPTLAAHPGEAILAVYDDSAFGRGRAGFVITDAAIHYANNALGGGDRGRFALADVGEKGAGGIGTPVLVVSMHLRGSIRLRVDEPDAQGAVAGFLNAVGVRNRLLRAEIVSDKVTLSARRAIVRLETLARTGKLDAKHRARLRDLVARLDADDARRASAAAERKARKTGRGGKAA